jgi:hypothetical protein
MRYQASLSEILMQHPLMHITQSCVVLNSCLTLKATLQGSNQQVCTCLTLEASWTVDVTHTHLNCSTLKERLEETFLINIPQYNYVAILFLV